MLSADSSINPNLWWALIILAMTGLLLIQLRRRQSGSVTPRGSAREKLADLRDQRDIRQSMDDLLLQLEDLSRRINAQVDTKFLKLETVVRDADERIGRLEGLIEQINQMRTRLVGVANARDPESPLPKSTNVAVAPASQTPTPNAAVSQRPKPRAQKASPETDASDPRVKRVYSLADAGKQPMHIAQDLDMPLGEVELILNLRSFR